MAAAEPADLTLHPALLVRAFDAGDAEKRVVTIVGAHRNKAGMFETFPA